MCAQGREGKAWMWVCACEKDLLVLPGFTWVRSNAKFFFSLMTRSRICTLAQKLERKGRKLSTWGTLPNSGWLRA